MIKIQLIQTIQHQPKFILSSSVKKLKCKSLSIIKIDIRNKVIAILISHENCFLYSFKS